MLANGKLTKSVTISALLLAPVGLCAVSTGGASLAGERDAPVAFSVSGLVGSGAFLGVRLEEETEYPEGGARITHVVPDSAADEAGLERGDIIVGVDDRTIRGPRALTRRMEEYEPGDDVSITVVRDGRERTTDVELGERRGLNVFKVGDGDVSWFAPRADLFECDQDDDDCSHSFSWSCSGDDCESFSFDVGSLWRRPMLGVQLVHVTDELREHLGGTEGSGVLVSKIVSGSAAEEADLRVGDLIVAVNGREVESAGDIRDALDGKEGETFYVDVIRDGRPLSLEVTLLERDDVPPSGPRALHFAPPIELKGLEGRIQEAMDRAREALGRSRDLL